MLESKKFYLEQKLKKDNKFLIKSGKKNITLNTVKTSKDITFLESFYASTLIPSSRAQTSSKRSMRKKYFKFEEKLEFNNT